MYHTNTHTDTNIHTHPHTQYILSPLVLDWWWFVTIPPIIKGRSQEELFCIGFGDTTLESLSILYERSRTSVSPFPLKISSFSYPFQEVLKKRKVKQINEYGVGTRQSPSPFSFRCRSLHLDLHSFKAPFLGRKTKHLDTDSVPLRCRHHKQGETSRRVTSRGPVSSVQFLHLTKTCS